MKYVYLKVIETSPEPDNEPDPVCDYIHLDEHAPEVTIDSGPVGIVNAADSAYQSLEASASDDDYGTGSGIASVQWTDKLNSGYGNLSFYYSTKLDTSVFDKLGSADGNFTLTLTVKDNAGYVSTDTWTFDWDRTLPPTPTIDGLEWTTDTTPPFTWLCNVSDLAGYKYSWDNSSWTTYSTTSTKFKWTAGTRDYGPNTLYLKSIDDADNTSNGYDSWTTYVSPDNISPLWGERGVYKYADIDWPPVSPILGGTIKYDLYLGEYRTTPSLILDDSLTDYWDHPLIKGAEFASNTRYIWYYRAYEYRKGFDPLLRLTSDTYTFWTE